MTVIAKLWRAYKSMALETATFLFMASVLMTYLVSQDVVISRVCTVNLGYSAEVCESVVQNNGNYPEEETNIQKIMTEIRKLKSILDYSIPIVFVIFQGSWSDIHGRKLPLILPCLGFILQALLFCMSLHFENWDGYTVVLVSTIPKCLSGSDVTFRMAALSYVSDISTNQKRTVRTGLISAAFTLGVPVGFALGGAIVKASVGNDIAFIISAGICTTALGIILIFVDNRPQLSEDNSTTVTATVTHADENAKGTERKCCSLSNIKSVLRSLMFSFDGVSTSARIQILVLIMAIVCINAPIQGEFGVMYLYLRKKFLWDLGDYGIFSSYMSLIGVTGTILSMGVLCTWLQLSDPIIGFIAGISQFAGCFIYAFASTNWMIYLAPAIDMLNGTMAVVAKSMLSKLIPSENFGKLFSFLAVIELLVPLVFDPTYSTLYHHTVDTFPGAVFLLSAAMTIFPQLTYLCYIWKDSRGVTRSCTITDDDNSESSGKSQKNSKPKLTSMSTMNLMLSQHKIQSQGSLQIPHESKSKSKSMHSYSNPALDHSGCGIGSI